jgi:hypothetical protein
LSYFGADAVSWNQSAIVGHILILGGCNVQKIKVHGTGIDYQSYISDKLHACVQFLKQG